MMVGKGGVDAKFWMFAGGGFSKLNKCKQGSKFWSFCESNNWMPSYVVLVPSYKHY